MNIEIKKDFYIVLGLFLLLIGYWTYNHFSAENRGVKAYSSALEIYKNGDYENAYKGFAKVPTGSNLKNAARFRQARCATLMGKKALAIKKYNKIVHSHSKTTIVPISEYNMAILLCEINDNRNAKKHFKKIIKKYPTSDYAIAAEYYTGLIEKNNLPKSKKRQKKAKERALINFKTYLEKSPDGRFALNSIDEIQKLDIKLSNYDNLVIAKSLYANGEYEKAKNFLNKTTLAESWTDFAKNEYKLGHKDKVRYYTNTGLKQFADTSKEQDVYEAIDSYIATFPLRKDGITNLVAQKYNGTGSEYILHLNCTEVLQGNDKAVCFKQLYEKYPNCQFSADALYNLFLTKYLQKKYYDAQRLGFLHLKKFSNAKSSPAVNYFMAKIAFKLKHYESANTYFKKVLEKYPDSYYALRAYYNLNKDNGFLPFSDITPKPVVFPYKKSIESNLIIKLALLKDYDLVEELCKKDDFIQSWIAYQRGKYTISAFLARKGMEETEIKPAFSDLRWRLVYPLHYYDIVDRVKNNNNPIILESIIKEESHFNKYAGSGAGAKGLMQLVPSTFNEITNRYSLRNDVYSPEINIQAGSLYYDGLLKILGNKDLFAISAYNGGMGVVTSWMANIIYNDADEFVEQIPYPETKNYVKKVLRTYWVYGNIY